MNKVHADNYQGLVIILIITLLGLEEGVINDIWMPCIE